MIELLNKWGLEYSFSQNGFFSAPLKDLIIQNRESLLKGSQHDFILVDIFESKMDLEKASDYWIRKMNGKILYTDIYGNVIVKPKE